MAGSISLTNIAALLSEVWAPAVNGYLDDLMDLSEFGVDYSSFVKGNYIAHIPSAAGFTAVAKTSGTNLTAQDNTLTDNALTLSNRVAVGFTIEDPRALVQEPDVFGFYAKQAADAVTKKINALIAAALVADDTNAVIGCDSDDEMTDADFRSGIKALLTAGVHIENETVFACNPTMYAQYILPLSTFNTYQITGAKLVGEGLKGYGVGVYPSNNWSAGGTSSTIPATMWHKSGLALAKAAPQTIIAPNALATGYDVSVWIQFGVKVIHGDRIQNYVNVD